MTAAADVEWFGESAEERAHVKTFSLYPRHKRLLIKLAERERAENPRPRLVGHMSAVMQRLIVEEAERRGITA